MSECMTTAVWMSIALWCVITVAFPNAGAKIASVTLQIVTSAFIVAMLIGFIGALGVLIHMLFTTGNGVTLIPILWIGGVVVAPVIKMIRDMMK